MPKPDNKGPDKKKTNQLNVRVDPSLQERFDNALDVTGLDKSIVVRAFIEAFCEEIEQKGGIWLPLRVIPKGEKARSDVSRSALAEPRNSIRLTRYPSGKDLEPVGFADEESAKSRATKPAKH